MNLVNDWHQTIVYLMAKAEKSRNVGSLRFCVRAFTDGDALLSCGIGAGVI